jgi:hypothetical protein
MELSSEQINKFKEIHKDFEDFSKYSEEEVIEIANGVVNYYLTLYKIHQRIQKDTESI